MKIKDMIKAVELLENEWDLGSKESGASRRLCAWIYLMEILEEAEHLVYYKENGDMLGFAGYSKSNSKKYLLRKKFCSIIKKRLYKSKKVKNQKALEEYYANFLYSNNDLNDNFDGELLILIINKKIRGKGIGKRILIELFELAKKDNVRHLQIFSDESCNYNIYESVGCKKYMKQSLIIKNI